MMNNRRLVVVDFLRGFSIFTIVLMHLVQSYPLPGFLQKATSLGGAGVHIFILCSGFGLYLSSLYKPLTYGQFLKRRFSKVYIPYLIVVIISALYFGLVCDQDVLNPLLGSVFLYKMFVPSLEYAFGGQMWFVSTIIQFYLFWPLIVRLFRVDMGGRISLLISLVWATVTTYLGIDDERIWNSFFLQYLWEFVLGMWLAKIYFEHPEKIKVPKFGILLGAMIVGLGLTGVAGIVGGYWKSYNDIPSLVGYMSMALIVYKLSINWINRFFQYTNMVSYEWYLIHILIFSIYFNFARGILPFYADWVVLMLVSYVVAIRYHKVLKKI